MIRWPHVPIIIAGTLGAWPALADLERTCTLGATVRMVEVRYAGDPGRPPCEVVYTKETEAPGREEVLWTATRDAGFCEAKADELAALLERNGWSCSPDEGRPDAEAAREPAPEPSAARSAEQQAPLPPPSRPEPADRTVAQADGGADPDPAEQSVRDLEQPEDPAEDGLAAEDPADKMAGIGGVFIPAEALEAAVERDLARLKKTADDSVEATVGSFGDLNDDDVEDAAVLITFDAEGTDHAQYLVAYVAEGGTYRPVASRFIGGRYRKVFGADVRTIRDGRIELDLQVLEPEDPFCCPSGSETAQFVLENGELVSAR